MSHEIGHNLGATHDPSGATIMSSSLVLSDVWSAQSKSTVNATLSGFNFLDDCSTMGIPVADFFMDKQVVCPGSPIILEDQSTYGATRTWDIENGTPKTSTESKPAITFSTAGEYDIKLTSMNSAGSDEIIKTIQVVDGTAQTCTPTAVTGTGGISEFSFKEINSISTLANVSGKYEDFTCSQIAAVETGELLTPTITLEGISYLSFYADFNGNGSFDNTEIIDDYVVQADGRYMVNLQLPANILPNQLLTLRIITSNNIITNACQTPGAGQVEDYGIYVIGDSVEGCTDPTATNYNPQANTDNGTCIFAAPSSWYRDLDGDGYGDFNDPILASTAPAGYVELGGDCDDTNPSVFPGATEVCDNLDNDCNCLLYTSPSPRDS